MSEIGPYTITDVQRLTYVKSYEQLLRSLHKN